MLMSRFHRYLVSTFFCTICFAYLLGQNPKRKAIYLSFKEAQPNLQTLAESLPDELKGLNEKQLSETWTRWVRKSDQDIRARLAQGDEDSLINFLLFGTSFTNQSRLTPRQIEEIYKQTGDPAKANERMDQILQLRLTDFIDSLAKEGKNERILFAHQTLVVEKGININTEQGRNQIKLNLLKAMSRVFQENDSYTRILQSARLLGDSSAEFAERSKLFRNRGLSSDTSLRPNFAIEEALKALHSKGLIKAGIKRVAIVGPGLDFTDKQEGYDFYPQQTIQPFAVIDSLIRLGLAKGTDLQLTTLDLSTKVNDHIARARAKGLRGQPYILQLPLDAQEKWKPEFIRYWEKFGNQIGKQIKPAVIPTNAGDLKLRALRVRPVFAGKITPVDTNIVLQRLDLAETEKFDLIIGTNIFVYYDDFQQSLAMLNMEKMLKPSGILLSNNALLELQAAKMKSVGYTTVVYSDRKDDGDIIVWYQRQPD